MSQKVTITSSFNVTTVEDGTSPVFADIDNEMFGVACDSSGHVVTAVDKTVTASLWYGSTPVTITSLTATSPSGITVTTDATTGHIRIVIAQDSVIAELNEISVVVSGALNGETLSKNLTVKVNGVRGGENGEPAVIYELLPSSASVIKKKDGTYSVSQVKCDFQRITGGTVETNPVVQYAQIKCYRDGVLIPYGIGEMIETSSFTKSLQFSLYIGATLWDNETIPMVSDGTDGSDSCLLYLDNSNDAILYGNTGPVESSKPETTWTFYKGGTDISDSVTASFTTSGCTAQWKENTNNRTIKVNGLTGQNKSGSVEVYLTYNSVRYSAIMSVKKLENEKFDIKIDPSTISYNETTQTSSGNKVHIWITRTTLAGGAAHSISTLNADGLTLFLTPIRSNGSEAPYEQITDGTSQGYYNAGYGAIKELDTQYAQYRVEVYKSGEVQDAQPIAILKVKNGANGRSIDSIVSSYAISAIQSTSSDRVQPSDIADTDWGASQPTMTNEKPYMWRKEVTTYVDDNGTETETRYYLQSVRGKDGTSPLTIDLDNEIRTVALDADGNVVIPSGTSSVRVNAYLSMYYGQEKQALTAAPIWVNSSTYNGISLEESEQSSGFVQFRIYSSCTAFKDSANDTVELILQGKCARGDAMNVVLKLIGMRSGVTYELKPSASAIVMKKDPDAIIPSSISCNISKFENGVTTNNPSEISLTIAVDGGNETSYTSGAIKYIYQLGAQSSIVFSAYRGTGANRRLVDRENIPIVADGENGENGLPAPHKEEIYYAWSTQTSTASPTTAPQIYGSWARGVVPNKPTGTYYLWMKVELYTYNSTSQIYDLTSTTYARISGEDAHATQIKGSVFAVSDGVIPTAGAQEGDLAIWTAGAGLFVFDGANWITSSIVAQVGDAYINRSDKHLWVYVGGTPAWADAGVFAGEDGESGYVHIAWAHSLNPATHYPDRPQDGFSTTKEVGQDYEYLGVKPGVGADPDPEVPSSYQWSNIKGADAITWRIMLTLCTIKVKADGKIYGQISGYLYKDQAGETTPRGGTNLTIRATRSRYWEVYTDEDGFFSTTNIPVSSEWLDGKNWSLYNNCQEIVVTYTQYGNIMAAMHIPVVQDGLQGERGKIGRNYYYNGDWDEFKAAVPAQTFSVTDAEAPFFSKINDNIMRYYVFVSEENGDYTASSAGEPDDNRNENWEIMVTDFKFLIGEAIFYDFAKLGSAIFNEDWMFSQHGYVGSSVEYRYKNFSPQFPNTSVQHFLSNPVTVLSTSNEVVYEMVMTQDKEYNYWIKAKLSQIEEDERLTVSLLNPLGYSIKNITFASNEYSTYNSSITAPKSGTYKWVARVTDSSNAGTIESINMQCDTPFIPTVAVDWLRGYAHFSNDKVRFNEKGDGYVAGGNISWDAQGNASFAGNVDAESGNIGDFVLDNGDLRVGANALWEGDTRSGEYTLLSKGRMRMKSILKDTVSIKLAMGNNANPGDSRALAISRTRMDDVDDYIPAVELTTNTYTSILDSRHNQIALRTTGLNVAKNGIASFGHIYVFNSSSYTLDLSKGCEWLLVPNSTSQRTLYLPTPYDINSLLYGESDAQFALKIMLVSHYSSGMGNILVRFQDSSALGFINHDGSVWHGATEGVTLTRGRMLELLLVYYAGSYYAQRLSDTL